MTDLLIMMSYSSVAFVYRLSNYQVTPY